MRRHDRKTAAQNPVRAMRWVYREVSRHYDRSRRHQWFWPHRPAGSALDRRARPPRYRGGGDQRPGPGGDQRPPAALRQRPWPLPRGDHLGRGLDRRGPGPDQGHRHPRSGPAAAQGPGRRHRLRMHGPVHHQGKGQRPPDRRRQARAGQRALRRGRSDHRLWRQHRSADRRRPGGLQWVVHHQLPRPGGQGAARPVRHRAWLHDHHPRLHRRPADAGYPAQGPLPRSRGGPLDDPHLHRRRQGRGPRSAGPEGQAGRLLDPGADAQCLGGRPQGRARPRHDAGRGQQGAGRPPPTTAR